MSLHFNTYSTVLLLSGLVTVLVAFALYDRNQKFIPWFFLLMVSVAIWAIFYAFELSSTTLSQMLLFVRLEYIGISLLPVCWIIFLIKLLDKSEWLSRKVVVLIFAIPLLTILFVNTNDWHHLHYRSVWVDSTGPFPLLGIDPGVWYSVHMGYFYLLLVLGLVLLLRYYRSSARVYRQQLTLILFATVIPWITNILYQVGFRPYAHIDLTPFSFVATALIISFGFFRVQLFSLVPYAREKLLDHIREGTLIVDARGKIVDLNQPMRRFLSTTTQQPVGELLSALLPTQLNLHHILLKQADEKVEILVEGTETNSCFEVSVTALRDLNGDYIGSLLLFWDVSSSKRTTIQLQQQADQLKVLNEVKTRIFSIVSHDLRSPFASLRGFLHLIETGMLSEQEVMELVKKLSADVGHTSSLLDNLLYWSKSQLRGEYVNPELFDLKSILHERMPSLLKKASEKQIQLIEHVDEQTLLYADRDMIDLVMRNLLSNAIKFCRAGDTITVSAHYDNNMVEISIRDTGIGIEPAMLPELFSYNMVSRAGTAREKGTGLGLVLCKEFVAKNKGTITAQSELGKGSTFSFRLYRNAHGWHSAPA